MIEEEKQNSAHVQVSVQLEDSDKKYNIRFTEEVDFIIFDIFSEYCSRNRFNLHQKLFIAMQYNQKM